MGVTITKLFQSQSRQILNKRPQREAAGWRRCHGLGGPPQTNEGNLSQTGLPGNPEFQVANPHEAKAWEDLSMTTVVWCFLEMHEFCTRCHLIPHILEVRGDTQPTDFSLMLWKYIRFLCVWKRIQLFKNELEFQEAKFLHQKWLVWDVSHSILQNRVYLYLMLLQSHPGNAIFYRKNEYHEWNDYNP